jgi:hypothetical protein
MPLSECPASMRNPPVADQLNGKRLLIFVPNWFQRDQFVSRLTNCFECRIFAAEDIGSVCTDAAQHKPEIALFDIVALEPCENLLFLETVQRLGQLPVTAIGHDQRRNSSSSSMSSFSPSIGSVTLPPTFIHRERDSEFDLI